MAVSSLALVLFMGTDDKTSLSASYMENIPSYHAWNFCWTETNLLRKRIPDVTKYDADRHSFRWFICGLSLLSGIYVVFWIGKDCWNTFLIFPLEYLQHRSYDYSLNTPSRASTECIVGTLAHHWLTLGENTCTPKQNKGRGGLGRSVKSIVLCF